MELCPILDYSLDLQCQDTLITELLQQIYSGILILFNLLTLVIILHFSTRGIKLLRIDV
jgi:hypothetical protein